MNKVEDIDTALTSPLYTVRLFVPDFLSEEQRSLISTALEDDSLSISAIREEAGPQADRWVLQWLIDYTPDRAEIISKIAITAEIHKITGLLTDEKNLIIEAVSNDINWLKHSYQAFEPFSVRRFYIYGATFKKSPPSNKFPLQIDAATAFGSGEHGTTRGCLEAIESLHITEFRPANILDIGTGSGILSIACERVWKDAQILSTDIEREAVTVTKHHGLLNKTHNITVLRSNGFDDSRIAQTGPYDLIIANILASPLKEMAKDLALNLKNGGYAILSGMLQHQAEEILTLYAGHNLTKQDDILHDDWVTLTLQKAI